MLLHALLFCTTFCLSDGQHHLVGKSYDWDLEQALLIVNPKGLSKRALVLGGKDKPARWVAEHSSLTFNQYGREFPNGGINDAGLVVEIMWLDETRAPGPDERPTVSELQWIQMQLDRFATVAEMVAAAHDVRIAVGYGKVHYMACDRGGQCAVFENLGGKMVVTRGKDLKSKVLTNDTYASSAAALVAHRGFGGDKAIPKDKGSIARFVRASSLVAAARRATRETALAVLDSVRNGAYSKWNIVYDLSTLDVTFRSHSRPALKQVRFGKLATACPTGEAKMLDLLTTARGDVTSAFVAYDPAANLRLVESSLAPVAEHLPPKTATLVANQVTSCVR